MGAVEAAEEPLVQIETRSAEAEAPKTEADLLKSPEHMADVAQLITESFEKSDRRPRRSRRSKVKPDETVKTHLKPIAEAVAGIVAEPDPLGKIAVTAKALETKEEEVGKVQVQAEAVELKAEAVEAAAESAVEAASPGFFPPIRVRLFARQRFRDSANGKLRPCAFTVWKITMKKCLPDIFHK